MAVVGILVFVAAGVLAPAASESVHPQMLWAGSDAEKAVQQQHPVPGEEVVISAKVPLALCFGLALLGAGSLALKGKPEMMGVLAVGGFMVCSSMMLVVNKLAVTVLPLPATVLALQLLSCGICVRLIGLLGFVEVEELKLEKVKAFGVTPLAFTATLVANMKILEYANVETFIMVRNATPLMTSMLDWLCLGRELPDRMSVFALLLALFGAVGYMQADAGFELTAYSWAAIWTAIFLFDQVYIKHVISTVKMTTWTRVYYNNILAGCFAAIYMFAVENPAQNLVSAWVGNKMIGLVVVALSCAMGIAMSYFAFAAREALSATGFTVVGNVCKVLSVVMNVFIWDKHATAIGLLWLGVVMLGSGMYTPSPLRKEVKEAAEETLPISQKAVK